MAEKDFTQWYVIQTYSNSEKKCYEALQAIGIETFFPTKRVRKRWSDRLKWVDEPLFKGYLFIKISASQKSSIFQVPYFFNFVRFNGEFATIRECEINAIKKIDSEETEIELVDSKLYIGQEVYVSSGPFKGIYAKLIDFNKKGKLLLEVTCIGKGILLSLGRTRVEITEQKLKKIG